ncbi:FHA domain-containing protein [Microcystis aeruginosa]|uniref:FHA domain-containing protein n=1 Tax=Microcystis aeruginosa PCC 9717 TaxID=1160286 RepID=I4FLF5_MICAE|nr:FHA domain-containing protein [Microcystis aeruginosa]CCH96480.1 hypothetical protein MICAB_2130002 [Microcystis aeruginosa PCC 9717]
MSYSNYPQDDLNNAPVEDPDYTTPEQEPDYQEAASDPWDDGTEAADADDSFLSEEVNEQEDIVSESFPEQEVDNHDENEPSITQENRTKSNQKAEKSSPNLIENIAVGSGKIKDISKNFKEISQNLKDSSNNIKETIKNPKGTPKNSQVPVKTVKKQSQPNQNTSNSNPINTLSSTPWLISFRWNYNGQLKEKTISPEEAVTDNKLNNVVIRIGRDQLSCNLVLEDNSVSRQHAEISFDEQQQMFFIKSLRPRNIIKVDGQNLGEGEKLSLKKDATIVLGKQTIVIADIQFDDLEPTNYVNVRRGDLDGGDKTKVIDYKNVNVKGEDLDEGDKTKVIDYKNVANADSNYIQNWAMNFQWKYDDGKQISKQISQADINTDNRFKGIMRIGRDKNSCVIHLENETVSRQHAEIYFNQEKKRLFIKSLQPKGTKTITMVDDQNLPEGKELPLKESGTITLGTQKLEYTKQKDLAPKEPLWWESQSKVILGAIVAMVGAVLANVYVPLVAHYYDNQKAYREAFDKHTAKVLEIELDATKKPKSYRYVKLFNHCKNDITYAYSFVSLDGVRQTKGWYKLAKDQPEVYYSLQSLPPKALLYLYAYTNTDQNPTKLVKFDEKKWIIYDLIKPEDKKPNVYNEIVSKDWLEKEVLDLNKKDFFWFQIPKKFLGFDFSHSQESFDYIDVPFIEPDIPNKSKEKFYRIQFDENDTNVTERVFQCSENTLKLTPKIPHYLQDPQNSKKELIEAKD